MATSATELPVDGPYCADYDDETDTEWEHDSAKPVYGMVIKLEPESDYEDSHQSSWGSVQGSSNDTDPQKPLHHSHHLQHHGADSDAPNCVPVKTEQDLSDCSMAVFPVRRYKSGAGYITEERHLLSQLNSCPEGDPAHNSGASHQHHVAWGQSDSGRAFHPSVDHAGIERSAKNKRKSSTARRLPVLLLRQRAKKKKRTKADSGQQVHSPVSETSEDCAMGVPIKEEQREEEEDGKILPVSPFPMAQRSEEPTVRVGKRGRKRNPKPQSFECPECGLSFRWPSRFKEHVRRHSGERPFTCWECGDSFASSSYLRTHQRKHSGLLPYPCVLCGMAFPQARLLTEHRRAHAEKGAFACRDCGLKCGSPSDLSKHRQAAHPNAPGDKPFVCALCPAAFQRSYHLETHMRTHTGERPFKCEVCGLAYTTRGSLKVHTRTHTGEKPFACPHCPRAFITSGQLKKHSRTHTKPVVTASGDSNTVYVQKLRSVSGDRAESAELRLEIQCFPKDSTYTCDICSEVFVRSIDLASHMSHDHPKRPAPAPTENVCGECGQTFSRAHTLKMHLRSHAGVRPFPCTICGKRFTQRGILNAHLRGHAQLKPFTCSVCGAGFSSSRQRQLHMQAHGEVRASQCVVCRATFSSSALLSAHMCCHDRSSVAAAFAASQESGDSVCSEKTQELNNSDDMCSEKMQALSSDDDMITKTQELDSGDDDEKSQNGGL